jgi:3-hydroxybutyryl-CoA dehydrogenase
MTIKIVGVIGGGVMGSDLALDVSRHDYSVILKDLTDELLEKAKERIRKNYKFFKMFAKDFSPLQVDDLLARIMFVTDYEGLEEADMVIENVTEKYEIKKQVFTELKKVCREDTIYGTNTSCISITKLAALVPNPDNVIGMHFLNPVPLKKLVELIRGFHTSDSTLEKTKSFLSSIGKNWVVVNDYPGFVTNRVLMLTINECVGLVMDGVAEPKLIDQIFTQGFGHKMGPLATADLIGLDTILYSLIVLYESYNDPKYRPSPLLQKMVDAGYLGRKTGKGFFEYQT